MDEYELIDFQFARAETYARQFALRHFEIPDTRRFMNLKNNIFQYFRKRHLNLDYSETTNEIHLYCFTCLAWKPKFHFC